MKFASLLLYLILTTIAVTFFVPTLKEQMDTTKNFGFAVISFISIFFYLFSFRKVYSSWVRFETLFLLGFVIVHFQIPYLFSIGIQPSKPDFIWLNTEVVNYATWLSSLAIHLWMIGSTLGFTFQSKKNRQKREIANIFNIRRLDFILLFSFIAFFALAGGSILQGAHDGMGSWGEGASYFMIVLRVSFYFRIYVFFRTLKKINFLQIIKGNLILLSTLFIYLLLFLLAGDRGPIMQIAIIIAVCYGIFIKKITLFRLMLFISVGALFFSIIGLGRSVEEGNLFDNGFNRYQESEAYATEELASSVRIMYRALTYFPDSFDYLYGLQFLLGLLGIIPFLSGFVIDYFQIPPTLTASSRFFTFLGQGNNVTYGEGTEILSDIFINFGLIGVFIIMFLYGYGTSIITYKALKNRSDMFFLILLVIASTAIVINRAQFLTPLKDILYILVLFYFVKGPAGRKKNS